MRKFLFLFITALTIALPNFAVGQATVEFNGTIQLLSGTNDPLNLDGQDFTLIFDFDGTESVITAAPQATATVSSTEFILNGGAALNPSGVGTETFVFDSNVFDGTNDVFFASRPGAFGLSPLGPIEFDNLLGAPADSLFQIDTEAFGVTLDTGFSTLPNPSPIVSSTFDGTQVAIDPADTVFTFIDGLQITTFTVVETVPSVPEPGSIAVLGLAGLLGLRRKR